MLAWTGYSLLQSRAAPRARVLARISRFSHVGALITLPFAAHEMWRATAGGVQSQRRSRGLRLRRRSCRGCSPTRALHIWPAGTDRCAPRIVPLHRADFQRAPGLYRANGEAPGLIHLIGGALNPRRRLGVPEALVRRPAAPCSSIQIIKQPDFLRGDLVQKPVSTPSSRDMLFEIARPHPLVVARGLRLIERSEGERSAERRFL